MKATGFKGDFAGVPRLPAQRSAVLCEDGRRTADARRLDRQTGRRQARRSTSACCRAGASASTGAGRDRAVLDGRSRRRAHLLAQHLRPAVAPAVQPAGADPARIRAGSCAARARSPRSRRTSPISARTTTSPHMAKAGRCIARSSAWRWASTTPRTRNSVARPTRCGAPRAWSSTPASITRAGRREQAITYLASHTALSQHEVETEVDRYISWPGQALSYKLGEMKIVELRARAEKELGARFDLRAFHDALLAEGSVPLPRARAAHRCMDRKTEGGCGQDAIVTIATIFHRRRRISRRCRSRSIHAP